MSDSGHSAQTPSERRARHIEAYCRSASILVAGAGLLALIGSITSLIACAMFYEGFLLPDAPPVDCAAAPGWPIGIASVVGTLVALSVIAFIRRRLTEPRF